MSKPSDEFLVNWKRWNGDVQPGELAHYCTDWDDLPIDETQEEFAACCCDWADPELQRKADLARERQREVVDTRLEEEDDDAVFF